VQTVTLALLILLFMEKNKGKEAGDSPLEISPSVALHQKHQADLVSV